VANPRLTVARKAPTVVSEEGCLSFPEIRGDVERAAAVSAEYRDQGGLPHTLVCTGLFARCMLHEVDHLNGVLFIDRMEKPVREAIKDALKALARETRLGRDPTAA
jgi:peptide deformylase